MASSKRYNFLIGTYVVIALSLLCSGESRASYQETYESNEIQEIETRYYVGGGIGLASLPYTKQLPAFMLEVGFLRRYSEHRSGEYNLLISSRSSGYSITEIDWLDTFTTKGQVNNIIIDFGYTFKIGIDLKPGLRVFTGIGLSLYANIYKRGHFRSDVNGVEILRESVNMHEFDWYDPLYFGTSMRHTVGVLWGDWQVELMLVQPRSLFLAALDNYSIGGFTIKYVFP